MVFLSDRLSTRGGANLHLRSIVERTAVLHRVALVVGRVERTTPAPPGIEVHRVRGLGGLREPWGRIGPVRELLERLLPQVIHVQNVMSPDVLETAIGLAPTVVTVQDHRLFCPGRGKIRRDGTVCRSPMTSTRCRDCFTDEPYLHRIDGLTRARLSAVRAARAIVVLSDYMRKELIDAGCDGDRVHVIPPFVDWGAEPVGGPEAGAFATLPARPMILAGGRLVAVKGVVDVIRSVSLSGIRPRPRLVVAGEGPELPSLRTLADSLSVEVEFVGWLDREPMRRRLEEASVVVLPSLWQEPFGIFGLEALERGVPVVAYDVGGIAEWLAGPGGRLVARGDVSALSDAIDEVLALGGTARSAAAAHGRALRETHAPTRLMARLFELYERLGGDAAVSRR